MANCSDCGVNLDADGRMFLDDPGMCFECNFWSDVLRTANADPRMSLVDSETWSAYTAGPENAYMKGFGGEKYFLVYNDGHVTETTNLWHRGTVPERWRERLPANGRRMNKYMYNRHLSEASITKAEADFVEARKNAGL